MPFLRAALIAGNHTEIQRPKKAMPGRSAEDLIVANVVKQFIAFDDMTTAREISLLGI